ncbi:hypothetical protein Q8F55_002632 [Vanrija albida]|uniref:WH1 domain-containing protein n=1 Tax=Vanrija albida TaxID=181172 RepID=A0ABR3QAX4_9TREE
MAARPPASPGPDAAALRHATNLRAVQRADNALAEILDTATYTVIYHYGDDRWIKQKQEGSMFVVRRTKAPEYALFLLNRAAIKNVTIPLVPGEMKAKVIDASMLQVSRRGEKAPYGIWFADSADVQRFADTILKVCGPPSAKPAAAADAAPPPPAVPAPITGASEDGFSRLFSGLTTVSGSQSASQSASPLPSAPAPAPAPPAPAPQAYPPAPFAPGPFQLPGLPIPGLNAPLPGPPPAFPSQPPSGFPPGAAGFPPGPPQGFPNQGPFPPSPQRIPPPFHNAYTPPPPVRQTATPPAASSEPPLKAPPPASLPAQSYAPGQTVDDLLSSILGVPGAGAPPAPPVSAPGPVPAPAAGAPASPPKAGPQGPIPSQAARRAARLAPAGNPVPQPMSQSQSPSNVNAADAAVLRDAITTPFANGARSTAPLGRQDLADVLVRLLQTDPRFVDDVWRTYLARIGAPQPPPHV